MRRSRTLLLSAGAALLVSAGAVAAGPAGAAAAGCSVTYTVSSQWQGGFGEADPVTREAYSREVISLGFWFGDDTFAEPAFYAYTAPEPAGLVDQPLEPGTAQWVPRNASHLAVLRYDDARAATDPRAAVLAFYESAYQAGARLAGWNTAGLTCPGGVTDPHL